MGERNSRLHRLLALQPCCIYCGGTTPADTIDHMPPKVMFDLKHRPKGMEFPACTFCNSGGRLAEQVAAMLGRVYPDIDEGFHLEEMKKIITSVGNNNPGILQEMRASAVAEKRFRKDPALPPNTYPLRVNGPLVCRAMKLFGAKLGVALHYEFTGNILPADGGIAVRWFSNYEALKGEIPASFLSLLGEIRTLKQGKFDVSEQFSWAGTASSDGKIGAYFATFRISFATAAFVHTDKKKLVDAHEDWICEPGFLKVTPP